MTQKHTSRFSLAKILVLIISGLGLLGLTLALMLRGQNIAVLSSKGSIAEEQRSLMVFATIVCLTIAVPTLITLYFTAWKYRESNINSKYHPEVKRGRLFNFSIWALPTVFMFVLATGLVPATHKLQPNKAIASDVKPLTIQVTAMRWKWVFTYPDQQIATVNYIQIPEDTPIVFDLIADEAPMSSFWIPNLGGQLYAMTGHVNQLNLIADERGVFKGRSAEINGEGFAGMKFTTVVTSNPEFQAWVEDTKKAPRDLNKFAYAELLKPSEDNPTAFYSAIDDSLYSSAIMKYAKHGKPATADPAAMEHMGSH